MHKLCLGSGSRLLQGKGARREQLGSKEGGTTVAWDTGGVTIMDSLLQAKHFLCPPPHPPIPFLPNFFQTADKLINTYIPRGTTSGCLPQHQGTGAFPLCIWQTTMRTEKDLGVKSRAWGKQPKLPKAGAGHPGVQALCPICVARWVVQRQHGREATAVQGTSGPPLPLPKCYLGQSYTTALGLGLHICQMQTTRVSTSWSYCKD